MLVLGGRNADGFSSTAEIHSGSSWAQIDSPVALWCNTVTVEPMKAHAWVLAQLKAQGIVMRAA